MIFYIGRENVTTITTKDTVIDIGMPSSGSSGEAEVIWIMLIVLPIVLPRKHYLLLRRNNIEEFIHMYTLIYIEVKKRCVYSETKKLTGSNGLPRIKNIDF